jgi:hypothetical protein
MRRDLVVIAWNGRDEPYPAVHFDVPTAFDLLCFDYSGTAPVNLPMLALSQKTEGKGEVCAAVASWLRQCGREYEYVGLLDDDVLTRISDLNYLFHVARVLALDVFAPALSRDGDTAHGHMLRQENRVMHRVPWVDIMASFIRVPLYLAAAEHFAQSISAWGLDCFLLPLFQKLTGMEQTAVIDVVMVRHCRPIKSDTKVYANGRNGWQELDAVHACCLQLIRSRHPELLGTPWFHQTFELAYRQLRGRERTS